MGILNITKEDKELMLEEIRAHREKILEHLEEIENSIRALSEGGIAARMDAYWLPSIKGALGSEDYPHAIMVSLGDTIKELERED